MEGSSRRSAADDTVRSDLSSVPVRLGGRYRLLEKLGEGAAGAMYAAVDGASLRPVAVRLLNAELSQNPEAVWQFLAAARAATSLAHPNVVKVLDTGVDRVRGAYVVTERLAGRGLRSLLVEREVLPLEQAVSILRPLALALVEAHEHGIVHRALKPDNIFLADTPQGVSPKILDFGIAKVALFAMRGARGMRERSPAGTPTYMAPELFSSFDAATPSTDVWALGVLLHEMLSGTTPFRGASHTEVFASVAEGAYVPASSLPGSASNPVADSLIARCLVPDPDMRMGSAMEFFRALDELGVARQLPSAELLERRVHVARPASRADRRAVGRPWAIAFRTAVSSIVGIATRSRPHENGS